MNRAREAGLDLVEVDANGNPPVCRILDYGKWKYEQAKKERDARKHQKGTMIHEVRMRPRTGQHDIELKVKTALRLLAEGDKVKLSVMFRGREIFHPEVGQDVMQRALQHLTEAATIEKPPGMEGRFLSVILTPTVKKPEKPEKPERPPRPESDATNGAESPEPSENGTAAAAEPAASEPVPVEPAAIEPAPAEPAATEPAPAKPAVSAAAPASKPEA